jgi:hypothetical protein
MILKFILGLGVEDDPKLETLTIVGQAADTGTTVVNN